MSFYVGQKVVVVSDASRAPVGTICEVVETKNLSTNDVLGIRYPDQGPNSCYPYQPPEWFCDLDVYNSPLMEALR